MDEETKNYRHLEICRCPAHNLRVTNVVAFRHFYQTTLIKILIKMEQLRFYHKDDSNTHSYTNLEA